MAYLEMDIIFSRFLLFLEYSPHPMIAFLLTRYIIIYLAINVSWLINKEYELYNKNIISFSVIT